MASFLDTQPVQFNPYIAHTPVEAYRQVEATKQAQYDQGTAALDSMFTTLTNLPIDSKYTSYVDASVSQLSEAVKKVGASDFSNRQLISKIEGAASQIAKDPIVQAGVISASNHQYNISAMQDDRKNGKLTPDNEYDYMDEYAKWKTNADLSTPFSYNYSTNIDINKKWMDVLKAINPTANITDIPFETDAAGNVDYNKIATVMTERGYKGVSPDQIKAAVQSSLSEADMNQLRISAKYRFRGYAPEDLIKISDTKYAAQRTELLAKKAQIEGQLKLYPETTEAGKQLKSSLDYVNDQLGSENKKGQLDINRENEAAWIRHNPDSAKTEIYKNTYIDQFSKAFSYMDQSTKYVESPYTKYDEWMKNYAMDVQKYNLDVQKFGHTIEQDNISNELERTKIAQKNKELGVGGGFTTSAGIDTEEVLKKTPIQTLTGIGEGYRQQAEALTTDLVNDTRSAGEPENVARANVNKMITDYQNGTLDKAYKHLEPKMRAIIRANSNMANISSYIKGVEKDVDASFSKSPEYQNLQFQINSRHQLKFGGYTFTPGEIFNFLNKESLITTTGSLKGLKDIDVNSLSGKERVLYDYVKSSRYNPNPISNKDQDLVNQYLNSFASLIEQNRGLIKNKVDLTNQYLKDRMPILTPSYETINLPDSKSRETMLGNINTLLETRAGKGGNEGLDISDTKAMIFGKNRDKIKVSLYKQPNNNQLVISDGNDRQVIKLNQDEVEQIAPELGRMNNDLAIRLGIGRTTTNYLGTPEGAYFQKADFPSVKNLNITADLHPVPGSQDANGNPLFYIEYNAQIDRKWRKLQLDVPLTIDQINANVQQVNDKVLLDAYSKQ